ncbi:MAG TPA: hypothetical protein VFN94_11315 [Nitrospiria bacterium]|nr:hypothetical protein [Nitrospiria bacterium]
MKLRRLVVLPFLGAVGVAMLNVSRDQALSNALSWGPVWILLALGVWWALAPYIRPHLAPFFVARAGMMVIVALLAIITVSAIETYREVRPLPSNPGIDITEAPPGVFPDVPEMFLIDFGSNVSKVDRRLLEWQVPFEDMSFLRSFHGLLRGRIPLQIFFDEHGALKINATIYGSNREKVAEIENSFLKIRNPKWDYNSDSTAFEIVDADGIPYFQVYRYEANAIAIRGVFYTSAGERIISTDRTVIFDDKNAVMRPQPLFLYPRRFHWGERVRRPFIVLDVDRQKSMSPVDSRPNRQM